MPKGLTRIIFIFIANAIALAAAAYFVKGFNASFEVKNFLIVTAIFTLIYVFVRPIIKLILAPVLIITLGLGIILVNAFMLYLLDFFSHDITINGLRPLFYATLIISLVHFVLHFAAKGYKD